MLACEETFLGVCISQCVHGGVIYLSIYDSKQVRNETKGVDATKVWTVTQVRAKRSQNNDSCYLSIRQIWL